MRKKSLLYALVAALFGMGILFDVGKGAVQKPAKPSVQKEKWPQFDHTKSKFYGADSCFDCHETPKKRSTDFVQLTEADTWFKDDKHSQAYEILKKKRSQDMGQVLGYDPAKADACLNCHAMNFPEERQGDSFKLQNGVSCDGCHGPAEHWFGPHTQQAWRLKTGEEKEAWGMIDVRDPEKRTKMCLSCHVGNLAEGKVVTHEMYAAGHPPLPGFEIATFSKFLPQHWRPMRDVPFLKKPTLEKPPKELKDPDALKTFVHELYEFHHAPFEETRVLVLGGVAALEQSMTLLAQHASGKKNGWPELAQFDCYACHHDLKSPSWRQRGYPGVPGRPHMQSWSQALIRLGVRHSAGLDKNKFSGLEEKYKIALKALHSAFDSRPFGEPVKVNAAATAMADWAKLLLADLREKPFDKTAAQRLLNELTAISNDRTLDYDSARQIGWAFKIIVENFPKEDLKGNAHWTALDKEMRLTLPLGKYLIDEKLPESLKKINDYDPGLFKKRMDDLRSVLSVK